ncbi:signal recognition particle receptor subunit alpha, partial [Klebsiella pneumoniae]|nr:signal recognition particle receptor subunit alpha [Klebsiella pneumoniae]
MNMVMDLNLVIWFTVGAVILAVALVAVAVVLRIIGKSNGPVIPTSKEDPLSSSAENNGDFSAQLPENATSRMARLRGKLANSQNPFGRALFNILSKDNISEDDWQDVEDTLLMADVGAQASEELVESLKKD